MQTKRGRCVSWFAVLAVAASGCAGLRAPPVIAERGVLLALSPSEAEQALGSIMKSRGSPVVDRLAAHDSVNLKFKSPTAVLYAELTPEGERSRLRLFGTSIVPVESGHHRPEQRVEVSHERAPTWMNRWLGSSWLAYDWHSEESAADAVRGAVIELDQAGLTASN